jgi:oligopeptide/dipeptide ABC transporter ATP-binding protein
MSEFKVLSKETITVDIKPGESLLIINKKKKLSPNSRITFEGENIIDIATKHAKRVDNSFMSLIKVYLTSLNPIRTIGKQCPEAISNCTGLSILESEVKLKETLNNLSCPDIDNLMKNFPFKLEAYEKQRLMFALAFLIKPKLIILDDTIFKMEPKIKSYILKELGKLRKENKTSLIFISKKLDIVNEGIDIIAIMYKGTVVEFAKKDLILTDPIHPYTKHLLNHKSTLDFTEEQPEIVDYVTNIVTTPRNGCSFCLNCKKASYDCVYMPPKIKTIGRERQVICNDA